MRLIDADELMEHVYRDMLDSREAIAEMIKNAPTVDAFIETEKALAEVDARNDYLERKNNMLRGQIKALVFAVRCNGVSGNEAGYEID